jgi:4-amino-4-deoxy-L-arabinose transferase-like glycosyltransferase
MTALPNLASTATATQRRELLLFLLAALIIIGAGIGLRDPWPADEPRFTLVAKQMVESGEWLITHRGSELYSDKPPMFMAMQAAMYKLTGQWRVAFLLPSLLASLGTLFLIYDLGRRLWNHRVGLWAIAAALAAFQFVYQAKRAQIDPLVTLFITAANYGLLRHFLLGPDWRAYWLGCFAAGLGVITKGVGVLALFMFLPFLYARWRGWQNLAEIRDGYWRWLAGALAFAAAVSLWIAPMLIAVYTSDSPEHRAYMNDILFRQTAGRYTDSWDHHQPPWYYLGVIAFSWMPLSIAMAGSLPRWAERLKARDARFLLPLVWIVLVVVFFSFPKGKRDVYIMPALPWLALMCAPFLDALCEQRWFRRTLFAFVVLIAVLFIGGGLYAWSGHWPRADNFVIARGLERGGVVLWGLLVAIGVVAAIAALALRVRRSVLGLAGTLASMWLLWSFWAYPVLNDSTSAKRVMQQAGELAGADAEIALVAWKEQNLLLADRKVTDFGFLKPWPEQLREAIQWQSAAPEKRWIFALDRAVSACLLDGKTQVAGYANRRRWLIFQADALTDACRAGRVPSNPHEKAHDDNDE